MEYPVELGATTLNNFAESKHFDKFYDKVTGKKTTPPSGVGSNRGRKENEEPPLDKPHRERRRVELPSPERDPDEAFSQASRPPPRDPQLEAESETSERVIREYENEKDDPKRRPNPSLIGSVRSKSSRRDSARMSYANGGYGRQGGSQPARSRYYDEDDDSDYDERSGRRFRGTGRGYDAERDRDFDREIIETERYRGVSTGPSPQHPPPTHTDFIAQPPRDPDHRGRNTFNDPYAPGPYAPYAAAGAGAGAMAPYRRSQGNLAPTAVSRRSKSRGRQTSYSRSDSRSRSRTRSRSRSKSGWRGKVDQAFDTTPQGIGVGIAGALVGGLAGRELAERRQRGDRRRRSSDSHRNRDMIIGALVGGFGANAAENQWREWKNKRELEREYEGDYGRDRR